MMMKIPLKQQLKYRRAPDLCWTVETRGVSMFTPAKGVFCCIPYPLAAAWDLIGRGYDLGRIVEMLRHIAGVSGQDAREMTVNALRNWTDLELLLVETTDG